MKRVIFALAGLFCAVTVSAQNWGVGARIGAGFQAQAEYTFENDNYIDGRFGMSWCYGGDALTAEFSALYQWNIAKMDWTPRTGEWFFDAGAGVGVGGRGHFAYVGVAGGAKLGIKFNGAPVKLAIDWSPIIGPAILYGGGYSATEYHKRGLINFGLSCVYCF